VTPGGGEWYGGKRKAVGRRVSSHDYTTALALGKIFHFYSDPGHTLRAMKEIGDDGPSQRTSTTLEWAPRPRPATTTRFAAAALVRPSNLRSWTRVQYGSQNEPVRNDNFITGARLGTPCHRLEKGVLASSQLFVYWIVVVGLLGQQVRRLSTGPDAR
jgi:hypothetical protein